MPGFSVYHLKLCLLRGIFPQLTVEGEDKHA